MVQTRQRLLVLPPPWTRWYNFTRPKLASLADRTQGKFLIGIIGGMLGDYLPLIDDYYFYSAT